VAASPSLAPEPVKWSGWDNDLFTRATAEKRFVILDLEAVWCHWCHVMEKTTYADPKVEDMLASKYLPVRVDQDANPDLSSREAGDAVATTRARQTLDAAIALIDPVWGGVFQYSEAGSWAHPHFEKI